MEDTLVSDDASEILVDIFVVVLVELSVKKLEDVEVVILVEEVNVVLVMSVFFITVTTTSSKIELPELFETVIVNMYVPTDNPSTLITIVPFVQVVSAIYNTPSFVTI